MFPKYETMVDHIFDLLMQRQVLLTDAAGRPAVLSLEVGVGRVLVMVPSFERYVSGQLAASPDNCARYRTFMQNLVTWATR